MNTFWEFLAFLGAFAALGTVLAFSAVAMCWAANEIFDWVSYRWDMRRNR